MRIQLSLIPVCSKHCNNVIAEPVDYVSRTPSSVPIWSTTNAICMHITKTSCGRLMFDYVSLP